MGPNPMGWCLDPLAALFATELKIHGVHDLLEKEYALARLKEHSPSLARVVGFDFSLGLTLPLTGAGAGLHGRPRFFLMLSYSPPWISAGRSLRITAFLRMVSNGNFPRHGKSLFEK